MYSLMIIADDGGKQTMLTIGGSRSLLLRVYMILYAKMSVWVGITEAMKNWQKPCLLG